MILCAAKRIDVEGEPDDAAAAKRNDRRETLVDAASTEAGPRKSALQVLPEGVRPKPSRDNTCRTFAIFFNDNVQFWGAGLYHDGTTRK